MVHLCGLCLRMLMCANNTAHSGGPVWRPKAMNSHRTAQIVLSVSAGWIWRFEVCCRQSGNVSSQTITSGYTRRKTEFVPSRKLFGISSTLPPPHWGVCSHHYQCSYSLSPLFLWVTLTRAWGRAAEEVEENGCVHHARLWLLHPQPPCYLPAIS